MAPFYNSPARYAKPGHGCPGDFAPPSITHRIASGTHPHNPHVRIREVATAVDAEELRLKSEATPPAPAPNPTEPNG